MFLIMLRWPRVLRLQSTQYQLGELRPLLFMQHRAVHSDAPTEVKVKSGRPVIMCTLGLEGPGPWGWTENVSSQLAIRERTASCPNIRISFVLHLNLSSPWPKTYGSSSDLEQTQRELLLFGPEWGDSSRRSACSLYQAEWWAGTCLHKCNFTFENAAGCLHCW